MDFGFWIGSWAFAQLPFSLSSMAQVRTASGSDRVTLWFARVQISSAGYPVATARGSDLRSG
ncbi:MAG: hypothetical protein DMF63_03920 [Acidobacteria bacterium]|nr:MAG: hypothetical protein DMF63_03920 [Acidobacteriota bacterium]